MMTEKTEKSPKKRENRLNKVPVTNNSCFCRNAFCRHPIVVRNLSIQFRFLSVADHIFARLSVFGSPLREDSAVDEQIRGTNLKE